VLRTSSSESWSSGEQNSDKDTRPAEWITSTSLVQKGTICSGLDHKRKGLTVAVGLGKGAVLDDKRLSILGI
jgi:hypothetical protein